MKNRITVLLCVMCLLAVVLAGCGGGGNTTGNGDDTTASSGPKVITIGIPQSMLVTDYDTNAYTLWLEEVSGYDIRFVKYASSSSDYKKQLSTETATDQKLPDILWRFSLSDDEIRRYGQDGYFVDLAPYFEDKEKSANWWRMTEKYLSETERERAWLLIHDEYRSNLDNTGEVSGPIYAYPSVETTLIDTMDFMPMINKQWLDALKLQAPTNLEELKTVLIAFRDDDPNGNGIPDEKPMLGCTSAYGSALVEWIINFYVFHNDEHYFNVGADGKLYASQTTDAYREALKYIRSLVAENLLHVKALSYTATELRNVLQNTDTVGVTVCHPSLSFTEDSKAFLNWEALDLYGRAYRNTNAFAKNVFITDSCADPDAAWDLLMHMCTEESGYRLRYGEPGVHWDYADEGSTSFMGIPAAIKVYSDIWNTINNSSWMALAGGVYPYSENEQNQVTGQETDFLKHKYEVYQDLVANFEEAAAATNKAEECPLLRFNEEEDDIAKTRSDAKKTVTTWRAHFINGTKDINNEADWAEYLDALDKAGLDDYLAASQICYDRMYKSGT